MYVAHEYVPKDDPRTDCAECGVPYLDHINQDELEQWTANEEVWYSSTLDCRTAEQLEETVRELAEFADDFDVDLDRINWEQLLEYVHV